MQPILKVENLTKVFKSNGRPDFTAVDHIGFELKQAIACGDDVCELHFVKK